jgi:hypothetical protein
VGDQLGTNPGRMSGLAPAFSDLALGAKDPVHGGDRRHIPAIVEQSGPHLGRGQVHELRGVQQVQQLVELGVGELVRR